MKHAGSRTRYSLRCNHILNQRGYQAQNYFAEVEQAAFNLTNLIPGVGFSRDKMLQGNLFSYGASQRCRLGVNHHFIPVDRARCPAHGYHRALCGWIGKEAGIV
jgi:catalase